VNIALTSAHGQWWVFNVDLSPDTRVDLNEIGNTGGYGAGCGGALAYWIIHACLVIPTQDDVSTSFDWWWNVFNGLHAVVGYRTETYLNDGVFGQFGYNIGLGAAVVPAWLNAVVSADCFQDNPMYCDPNRSIMEPLGRASAVVVDGHGDDTAYNIDPLGPATELWEFWFCNTGDCSACTPS
jgi:hypothetical protein